MFNQTNPDRGIDSIREEILLTEGTPTFRVNPIERWKGKFRKPASELIGAIGLGVGRVNGWYRRGIMEMEGFVMKIGMGWRRGVKQMCRRMVNWIRWRTWRNDCRRRTKFRYNKTRLMFRKHTIGRDMGPSRNDSGPSIPWTDVDAVPAGRCGVQTGCRSQCSRRRW